MRKVVFALTIMVSFAACKKTCYERHVHYDVCAEDDTTLAYQLIVGKWYMREEYSAGPHGSSDVTCYARGPEPVYEFFTDRTVIFHSASNPWSDRYSFGLDSSGTLILVYGNGRINHPSLCDSLLSFSGYTIPVWYGTIYTKD
jgi:hypothetical protein